MRSLPGPKNRIMQGSGVAHRPIFEEKASNGMNAN